LSQGVAPSGTADLPRGRPIAAPVRPVVAASVLALTEKTVRAWAAAGVLTIRQRRSRLLLETDRVHEVRHLVRDLRRAGKTRGHRSAAKKPPCCDTTGEPPLAAAEQIDESASRARSVAWRAAAVDPLDRHPRADAHGDRREQRLASNSGRRQLVRPTGGAVLKQRLAGCLGDVLVGMK